MSETNLVNATRRSAELSVSVATGAILALMAAATWIGSASAQQKEKIPDSSLDSKSAWLMISDNLLPPESGPPPDQFRRNNASCLEAFACRVNGFGADPTAVTLCTNRPV
jgi:hypothetical protein